MQKVVSRLLSEYESGRVTRRELVLSLAALAAVPGAAQPPRPPIEVSSLNHVTAFVPDPERSASFYRETFGMSVLSRQAGGVNLAADAEGRSFVGLFGGSGTEAHIHHFCLGVEDFDVDRLVETLRRRGLEPQVRMRDDAVPEIYFLDPDGIRVQLQHPGYCGGSGPRGDECD